MNCTCISDLEKKLSDKGYDEASCINRKFVMENLSMDMMLAVPFGYRAKNKDGTYKKRLETVDIRARFCPFCGKSTEKGDTNE